MFVFDALIEKVCAKTVSRVLGGPSPWAPALEELPGDRRRSTQYWLNNFAKGGNLGESCAPLTTKIELRHPRIATLEP